MTQDHLFQQLKHPNPHLRERASLELAETLDETTIPRLIDILGEEDVTYRRAAVKALGIIGPDATLPLVELLLSSNNVTIQSSCAKGLTQIAVNYPDVTFPDEALQGLKTALNDPNPVVGLTSVMALGEIGISGQDILIETLETTDNVALAVAIVNALATIGDSRGAEILTALVNDESADSYVRESATSALSRLDLVKNNTRLAP
ncbi:HEAT repeat domain-containing protein [Nostocaceae cyanobacterium CENA369]|uniref:HEAT repeat domain-containing protein n=1 Tax=Dendronalium phyllosphericum CENA369 TaxID=1725256 RepID=A0A8J7LNP0_9NOST|nr:HEAT repeat domain-containing protein [Dendronalium phyllosphericum]MBH8577554.1 HEAT repeat domain-containing protein [Dendronalium phyllosphericum CENA369]